MTLALISLDRLGCLSAQSLGKSICQSIFLQNQDSVDMFLGQLSPEDREDAENGYEVEAEVDSLYFQA